MSFRTQPRNHSSHQPIERVQGSVERVTFHSEETGFCVLRTKVKGHRDSVTVIGQAASINAGEFMIEQHFFFNFV